MGAALTPPFKWPSDAPLCAVQIDHGPEMVLEDVSEEERPERVKECIRTLAAAWFPQDWSQAEAVEAIMEWAAAGLDYPLDAETVREWVSTTSTETVDCQANRPCPAEYCEPDKCPWPPAAMGGAWFDPGKVAATTAPSISKLARQILEHGDPVGYVQDTLADFYVGNRSAAALIFCCKLSSNVRTSRGLHPKLTGESGDGKSALVEAVLHLLPEESYIKASLSSKALFYNEISPGTLIFCDDYRQSDEIDTILKQTTSKFHQPYNLLTVDRRGGELKGRKVSIPSELIWCITSVDSDQDLQVLNRAIPLDVDDSLEVDRQVADHFLRLALDGEEELCETGQVEICREMFRQLMGESLKVKIPFANRILWKDPSNRRNLPMFLDILQSLTFWRRFQRETDETGCLLATEQDFEDAKALYSGDRRAESFKSKLTAQELRLVLLIKESGGVLTRQEAAEKMGVSVKRIDHLTRGKPHGGEMRGGLESKLPGFQIIDARESVRLGEDRNRTVRRIEFKIKQFDLWSEIDQVVSLRPPLSKEPRKNHERTHKGTIHINNSRDIGTKGTHIEESKDDGGHPEKNPSFSQSEKMGSFGSFDSVRPRSVVPNGFFHGSLVSADSGSEGSFDSRRPDLATVRFISGVGKFVGVDGYAYGPFEREDVAFLPTIHAENLIERGAARLISVGGV